eukprot:6186446-Pleurochrysis_carterae.AAC.1
MPPSMWTARKRKVSDEEAKRSKILLLTDKVAQLTQQMERLLSPAHPLGGFQLRGMNFSEAA